MANKVLKIESVMSAPQTLPIEKALKKVAETARQTFSPKMWKDVNKEVDRHVKYLKETYKITKQQGEAYREHIIKPLKEQEALHKRIETTTRRSQLLFDNAERMADRRYQRRMQGVNALRNPGDAAAIREEADYRYAGVMSKARGTMGAGFDYAASQADARQEEARNRRQEIAAKIMAGAAAVRIGGAIASGVGELYYGQSMRELGHKAGAAGFANTMYNQLTSGDISGLFAMMEQPGGMSRMRGLLGDAKTASQLNLIGQGLAGAAQMGIGGAQTFVGTTMTGPWAPMNVSQGLETGLAGGLTAGRAWADYSAGKVGHDVSNAALQGMQFMQSLNGPRQRQLAEVMGRLPQLAELASLSGKKPGDIVSMLATAGEGGGLTFDQTQSLYETMGSSSSSAAALSNVGVVARAPRTMGIGREAAMAGMASLTGMAGGSDTAGRQLFEIMRRATSMGMSDAKIREAIVTTLPQIMETQAGRMTSSMGVTDAMSAAMRNAALQGRTMDTGDIRTGMGAVQAANMLTGGRSGIGPLDVGMAGALLRTAKAAGVDSRTAFSLSQIPFNDLGGTETRALLAGAGIGDRSAQDDIINKLRGAAGGVLSTTFPGMNTAQMASALARQTGANYDTMFQSLSMLRNPAAMVGLTGGDITGIDESSETGRMWGQVSQRAKLMNTPLVAGAQDESINSGISGVQAAGQAMVDVIGVLSKTDASKLGDIPGLLDAVTVALGHLGDAAAVTARNLGGTLPGQTSDTTGAQSIEWFRAQGYSPRGAAVTAAGTGGK